MSSTREHILKTSLLLFLQKSYRDVTMSEIVAKTGLSKGAFYHYFKSKEDLFKEIGDLFLRMGKIDYSKFRKETLKDFYLDYIAQLDSSMGELGRMVSGGEQEEVSYNFFLIMFEAATRFPGFMQQEYEMFKQDLAVWTEVVTHAREMGEISSPSSDSEIARLFLYLSDGVFIRFMNSDREQTFMHYLEEMYTMVYRNLLS